ncbi:hypothetical protein [Streptomyces sp. NPDC001781]
MSVLVRCDRCGNQEKTSGVMLFAGLTGPAIPTARAELPDGWSRPLLPHDDGSAWHHELCPACRADLVRFLGGAVLTPDEADECSDCGHVHVGKVCREMAPAGAEAGECGCAEGVPDLGTGAASDQICPGCGHLRHSDPCPDYVPEVGACGCKDLTSRERMKELGLDD